MLQVIGWLLCLYLVVKACELLSMQTEESKFARFFSTLGGLLALLGAVGFFLLINEQVEQSNKAQQQLQSTFPTINLNSH